MHLLARRRRPDSAAEAGDERRGPRAAGARRRGPGLRAAARLWVGASLPVAAVAGLRVGSARGYLVALAAVASAPHVVPAVGHTALAARRGAGPDARATRLWLAALVLIGGVCAAMVAGAVVAVRTPAALNAAVVAAIAGLLVGGAVAVVGARSGRRAVSVDLADSAMSVVVVTAPAALVWGDDVLRAADAWYALPAATAAVAMVLAAYWAVLLRLRVRRAGRAARTVGRIAVGLAVLGLADAVAQTAQGVRGFDLPSAPLLALHALCMGLLLLVPLHLPPAAAAGLGRAGERDRLRGAWLPAALVLAGLPVLVAVAAARAARDPWSVPAALGVAALLAVLAAVRQLAAVGEARRLHGELARAAAVRRELLAEVVHRADHDRHRVAAQLHEQAVAAYAAFVAYVQATAPSRTGPGGPRVAASAAVRDALRAQAESLRRLMLAVQPLGADRPLSPGLAAPIRAYVDALYGDGPAPELTVAVDDDLVLDWTTETLVLRIAQEALRNVWRHSGARRVEVALRRDGAAVELLVVDDGVGFAPDRLLFTSGIAAMRSFAELGQGTLTVDSRPGGGTRVVARLGAPVGPDRAVPPPPAPPPSPRGRPVLRLVRGGGGSGGEA